MNFRRIALLTLVATSITSSAWALEGSNSRSKYALNVAGVSTSGPDRGWLVDFQYDYYLNGSLLIYGLEAGYGMPVPTSGNALMYGGLIAGIESMTKWGLLLGATVSVEAAQATQNGTIVGPNVVAAVKPQVYFGFNLGGGFRFAVSGGYLAVSSVPQFSGLLAGIRIDYKMETSTKAVED